MTSKPLHTRRFLVLLWVTLAALFAVSPLMARGISCGHDLSFHLLNWMEVASQWEHGVVRPFWCFHAAWNAGEPRFVFYPPLSWTLGALLSLVLPLTAVPSAYVFVVLLLCGLTMYRLLRSFITTHLAALGSCMYLANPYALFTAFERSAYAELLAAAWMPLLLRAVLLEQPGAVRLAVPVALLWLTNAPAAVAGSYALLVLGGFQCARVWRHGNATAMFRVAFRLAGGYTLGLAFAALFLLPAIVQRRFVQIDMALIPGMRPEDNFIFTRMGQAEHDLVLHQASLIAVGLLGVGILCAALRLVQSRRTQRWHSMRERQLSGEASDVSYGGSVAASLGLLLVLILFLLTSASALVWRHAPELPFLQFPWRFLAVGAPASVALVVALLSRRLPRNISIAASLIFALAAGWGAHWLYSQPCDDEDTPVSQQALFAENAGSEPTDEYTPRDADNDAIRSSLPEAWTSASEDDPPKETGLVPFSNIADPLDREYAVPGTHAKYLIVRLRQFHGWRVDVDGAAADVASQRNDGLFAIPLDPGPHNVRIFYRHTWDEVVGLWISIAALAAVVLVRLRRNKTAVPRRA